MPHQKQIAPFLLAVVDHDKGTFTIEGAMTDDTSWINAECEAQKQGRQVNCHTIGGTREEAVASLQRQHGWRYAPEEQIVTRRPF